MCRDEMIDVILIAHVEESTQHTKSKATFWGGLEGQDVQESFTDVFSTAVL